MLMAAATIFADPQIDSCFSLPLHIYYAAEVFSLLGSLPDFIEGVVDSK